MSGVSHPYVNDRPVSQTNPMPIGAGGGALTDRSGTITTGGTSQQLAPVNNARKYLLVQNPTTASESFWIAVGTAAVAASPSIEIAPGVTLSWESSFVPSDAVNVIAATTGTAFVAKEG